MMKEKNKGTIAGFSKMTKVEKLNWLIDNYLKGVTDASEVLAFFNLDDESVQKVIDGFSENTVSNFVLPLSLIHI